MTRKTDRPLRVLHTIPAFMRGGAERVIVDLFREHEADPIIDLQFCVFGQFDSDVYEDFKPHRQPVSLGFHDTWRSAAARKCRRELLQLIDEFQPDVLHSHLWLAHYFTAVVAAKRSLPHVCHIQAQWDWMSRKRLSFQLRRWCVQQALQKAGSRYIACSRTSGDFFVKHLGADWSRIRTIPNSVDTSRFCPAQQHADRQSGDNVFTLGTAGRFVPEKGHAELIRVVHALRNGPRRLKLLIAGQGESLHIYQQMLDELDLHDHVTIVGLVADMESFYRSLHLYVHPSTGAEGLPLAVLEALSTGCPVVATDCAGTREAVVDGQTGLLVTPNDLPALTSAVRRVIEDADLAARMSTAARQHIIQNFSAATMANEIRDYYGSILDQNLTTATERVAG